MRGACPVSVMPPWTPHASVSSHPTLFYIFYKCAKLCGFCQEWWSLVASTSRGQDGSTAGFGPLRHSLCGGSRQVLSSHVTQSQERSCTFFIVSQNLGSPPSLPPPRVRACALQAI